MDVLIKQSGGGRAGADLVGWYVGLLVSGCADLKEDEDEDGMASHAMRTWWQGGMGIWGSIVAAHPAGKSISFQL